MGDDVDRCPHCNSIDLNHCERQNCDWEADMSGEAVGIYPPGYSVPVARLTTLAPGAEPVRVEMTLPEYMAVTMDRMQRLETLVRWLAQREIASANRAHTDLSERVEIAKLVEGMG